VADGDRGPVPPSDEDGSGSMARRLAAVDVSFCVARPAEWTLDVDTVARRDQVAARSRAIDVAIVRTGGPMRGVSSGTSPPCRATQALR